MPGINAGGAPPAMNLSDAMSGTRMCLNGGGNMDLVFNPVSAGLPYSKPRLLLFLLLLLLAASGTDPFVDLAWFL